MTSAKEIAARLLYGTLVKDFAGSGEYEAELLAMAEGGWQLQWFRRIGPTDRADGIRAKAAHLNTGATMGRTLDWVTLDPVPGESFADTADRVAIAIKGRIRKPVAILVRNVNNDILGCFVCRAGVVIRIWGGR